MDDTENPSILKFKNIYIIYENNVLNILKTRQFYYYNIINYNKEILVSDYFDIHNFYKKKLGDNVIILMQVDSFHECYGTDTDGPDLNIVK